MNQLQLAFAGARMFVPAMALLSLAFGVSAGPVEDCESDSSATFEREYGQPNESMLEGQVIVSRDFRGVYSLRRDACFYLLITDSNDARAGWARGHSLNSVRLTLVDLKSQEIIGQYFKEEDRDSPESCSIGGTVCRSEVEWMRMLLAEL